MSDNTRSKEKTPHPADVAPGDRMQVLLRADLSREIRNSVTPNEPAAQGRFIDDAIASYFRIANLVRSGGELFARDPDGAIRAVRLPFQFQPDGPPTPEGVPQTVDGPDQPTSEHQIQHRIRGNRTLNE